MSSERTQGRRRESLVTLSVIAAIVLAVLGWGFLTFRAIGDRSRDWHYGAPPLVPAESYYSTEPATPPAQAPKQIEMPPPTIKKKAR